jgi:hypothetical protein
LESQTDRNIGAILIESLGLFDAEQQIAASYLQTSHSWRTGWIQRGTNDFLP